MGFKKSDLQWSFEKVLKTHRFGVSEQNVDFVKELR